MGAHNKKTARKQKFNATKKANESVLSVTLRTNNHTETSTKSPTGTRRHPVLHSARTTTFSDQHPTSLGARLLRVAYAFVAYLPRRARGCAALAAPPPLPPPPPQPPPAPHFVLMRLNVRYKSSSSRTGNSPLHRVCCGHLRVRGSMERYNFLPASSCLSLPAAPTSSCLSFHVSGEEREPDRERDRNRDKDNAGSGGEGGRGGA